VTALKQRLACVRVKLESGEIMVGWPRHQTPHYGGTRVFVFHTRKPMTPPAIANGGITGYPYLLCRAQHLGGGSVKSFPKLRSHFSRPYLDPIMVTSLTLSGLPRPVQLPQISSILPDWTHQTSQSKPPSDLLSRTPPMTSET